MAGRALPVVFISSTSGDLREYRAQAAAAAEASGFAPSRMEYWAASGRPSLQAPRDDHGISMRGPLRNDQSLAAEPFCTVHECPAVVGQRRAIIRATMNKARDFSLSAWRFGASLKRPFCVPSMFDRTKVKVLLTT